MLTYTPRLARTSDELAHVSRLGDSLGRILERTQEPILVVETTTGRVITGRFHSAPGVFECGACALTLWLHVPNGMVEVNLLDVRSVHEA